MASLVMPLSILRIRSIARLKNCTSWSERKVKSKSLFFSPIQLLIQGQWWSKVATHLPQSMQCLTLSYWSMLQMLQCLSTLFKTEGMGANPEGSLTTRVRPISPSMIWESKMFFSWGISCCGFFSSTFIELWIPSYPTSGIFYSIITSSFLS